MPPRLDEAAVLAALRPIVDPDFGKSIVDLGFVKNLVIDFRKLDYISSAGLGVLKKIVNEVRTTGGDIRLALEQ